MPSALLIPVPEAEPLVKSFRDRFDASAAVGVPAHITLVFPFAGPPALDEACCEGLANLVAGFAQFSFALQETRRFPRVLYLAPEPDQPFRALTEAIVRLHPEFPPYGGAFPNVTPHLTVAETDAIDRVAEEFDGASRGILPIAASANVVVLMVKGDDGWWRHYRSFALGRPVQR